jgi:hypothetical protein
MGSRPTGPTRASALTATPRMRIRWLRSAGLHGAIPSDIPLREPFGIRVVLGRTKPAFEGYGAIDPIIEVLVDVGMIDLTPDFGRPSLS